MRFVDVQGITVVGERINPTGKKRLQQALRDGDSAYPCAQAVAQAEAGAQVLDVNAGLPGIDEAATLEQLVKDLQAVTDLPLQLDSSNPEALSRALRIYNGKPIVNSVNGEQETLDKILPLCKKYEMCIRDSHCSFVRFERARVRLYKGKKDIKKYANRRLCGII